MNENNHNSWQPTRSAVFGASGGIGRALVERLAAGPGTVYTLTRTPERAPAGSIAVPVDILSEESVEAAARRCGEEGPLDLVIVATGMLHRDGAVAPEKSMRQLDAAVMAEVFAVNTIAPAIVAKHFLPLLSRDGKSVFAALSARVGSIADNRLGGWASYRASKAALNMLLKTLSIEQARTHPRSVVIGLHPGTVDTALSKPFQGNVPEGKLFSTERAAQHLLDVIKQIEPGDSGDVFAWDGRRIQA